MNLKDIILKEHSKKNCEFIVNWVGNSQQRFDELFYLFLNDEYRVVQRAAWPISYSVQKHPEFITKHFAKLIQYLEKPGIHDAVKRNTVRLLQDVDIPEKYHGAVMNTCFTFVSSPDEPAAIKAFSLTILDNLSDTYPEIKNELKLVIEERWDYETAAFHSRAKKILKKYQQPANRKKN